MLLTALDLLQQDKCTFITFNTKVMHRLIRLKEHNGENRIL